MQLHEAEVLGPKSRFLVRLARANLGKAFARRRRDPSPERSTLEATRTALVSPSSRILRSLTMTTAAAPSPIGEHIGRVSGSAIIGAASTSSTLIASRNWARGLSEPW